MKETLKKHRWDIAMALSLLPAAIALLSLWYHVEQLGATLTVGPTVAGVAAIAVSWFLVVFFGRKKRQEHEKNS